MADNLQGNCNRSRKEGSWVAGSLRQRERKRHCLPELTLVGSDIFFDIIIKSTSLMELMFCIDVIPYFLSG